MTLKEVKANQVVQIKSVSDLDVRLSQRLKELGVVEGREVFCIKVTPFGGPGIYRLGDSVISLDMDLAEKVQVYSEVKENKAI